MKNYIKVLLGLFVIVFSSCDEWLEIKPTDKIRQKDLYASSYGFRTSINGLYMKMGSPELYGRELGFASIDVLSKQYNITPETMHLIQYRDVNECKFDTKECKEIFDGIWNTSYNIISNANNIINEVKQKPINFFKNKEIEKNIILGEALAIRAFLHFDLMRIFAPAPISGDNGAYIPYVNSFPNIRPTETTVNECLENIIEDLKQAKELITPYDTTEIGEKLLADKSVRFLGGEINVMDTDELDLFFRARGYKFNSHAINAVLARVYQYSGDHKEAFKCAKSIIDLEINSNKVYGFNTDDVRTNKNLVSWDEIIENWDNKKNLRLLDNLIFAVYNPDLDNPTLNVINHFRKQLDDGSKRNYSEYFVINDVNQEIFNNSNGDDESIDDIRYKDLIFKAENNTINISGKWYYSNDKSIRKNNFNIIPLIRLTEMYYIAAESYARDGKFGKAKELLMKVRAERGCTADITVTNLEEFIRELIIDARREWISEGQLFYLYKRLDAKVNFADGKPDRKLTKSQKVIPVPSSQTL